MAIYRQYKRRPAHYQELVRSATQLRLGQMDTFMSVRMMISSDCYADIKIYRITRAVEDPPKN